MHKVASALIGIAAISQALALDVPITVRESAGVGTDTFPVQVVIPLADGSFTSTASFGILDPQGNPVPAQFEVLERDWIEDGTPGNNSILHVAAIFQATVGPGATAIYRFNDLGNAAPVSPATVVDSGSVYTVSTGPLQFTVNKTTFNILDTVWYDADGDGTFENSGGAIKGDERIVLPSSTHGGRYDGCTNISSGACTPQSQHDATLTPDRITVEESGPMRAVLRVERYTDYSGVNDHKHGYVVRIYAYAGKPYVKIDYQLINAATGPTLDGGKFANPLYFNALGLEWGLSVGGPVTVKTSRAGTAVDTRALDANGVEFAYTLHDRFAIRHADGSPDYATCNDAVTDGTNDCDTAGFMDLSDGTWGVQAVLRNMWETWPNGLEATASGGTRLQIQLWPDWAAQWNYNAAALSGSGLYWLDDMRAVYKEVLLNFHGVSPSEVELNKLARTFDRFPVPVVPLDQYKAARVTYDGESQTALAAYVSTGSVLESNSGIMDEASASNYRMGWARWSIANVGRLITPHSTGSAPESGEKFLYTGSPSTYWETEREAIAELNARPQWMGSDYTHSDDWAVLGLTQAPYGGGNWRAQNDTASYRIAGTSDENAAMDDAHFWAYHVMDYYWLSGNPWVRDWMRFLGEFRRPRLLRVELYPAEEERDIGHALEGVVQGYRATGDPTLIQQLGDYVGGYLHSPGRFNPQCGHIFGSGGSANPVAFQNRVLIGALEKLKRNDWRRWADVFAYVSGYSEWNLHYGQYGYQVNRSLGTLTDCVVHPSYGGGTGWNVPDVISWYYWNTGKIRFKNDNDYFVSLSDSAGGPYTGVFFPNPAWNGTWAGRYYYYEDGRTRTDATPPPAITNLTATASGTILSLSWLPPSGAAYYLVVWADRPIVECTSNCAADPLSTNTTAYRNWWAGAPYACDAATCNGSVVIDTSGRVAPTHVAVFSFDSADNMSAISNVAAVGSGTIVVPNPPGMLRVGQ